MRLIKISLFIITILVTYVLSERMGGDDITLFLGVMFIFSACVLSWSLFKLPERLREKADELEFGELAKTKQK